jgi:hypothetical protein
MSVFVWLEHSSLPPALIRAFPPSLLPAIPNPPDAPACLCHRRSGKVSTADEAALESSVECADLSVEVTGERVLVAVTGSDPEAAELQLRASRCGKSSGEGEGDVMLTAIMRRMMRRGRRG